ncbi:copper amine oxidase N-terminal domain-containing protein [Weizmannia ginsengihumi]|nr:copper amine oxidase N-terminal domain-containing protein [Heyndrickxia ginsengihumi]
MMDNGRVLVPMRTIFEVVGADVQWVAQTSTVKATKGDLAISLPLSQTSNNQRG